MAAGGTPGPGCSCCVPGQCCQRQTGFRTQLGLQHCHGGTQSQGGQMAAEQKAHGKEDFTRFSHWLCPRAAAGTGRAEVLSTAMPEQPLRSLKAGTGLSNLSRHHSWTQETLPQHHSQTLDFTSQKLQLNPGPSSAAWAHQGQHIHQGSAGLLCAISSVRAPGRGKAFQSEDINTPWFIRINKE